MSVTGEKDYCQAQFVKWMNQGVVWVRKSISLIDVHTQTHAQVTETFPSQHTRKSIYICLYIDIIYISCN